jgi:excisionase family DNA binding protein
MTNEDDMLLSVADVATRLKVHPETVRRWIRAGKIKARKTPGARDYRIRQSEIDRYEQDNLPF